MIGIPRDMLRQMEERLRPHAIRVANMIVRAVVKLVDDSKKMQLVQIDGFEGGPADSAEHVQPYGFSSVPLAGADTAVAIFPNGDRAHPIVLAIGDRRYRPTGRQPGEVTIYNHTGAKAVLTEDGDIRVTAAPGRQVIADDGSGAAALPTMADFNGIISIMNAAGTGAATALPAAVASYQASHPTWPVGTTVLKGK